MKPTRLIPTMMVLPALLLVVAATTGCPEAPLPGVPGDSQAEYDKGFDDGFLEDQEYWNGYYDSYDTLEYEPLYYTGDQIPFLDELSYEAGYWDGVWYAYHDGYWVDYRQAFIIGFSEGYDNAYWPDYLDFLAGDVHVENLNGGWGDGYNDGFSEGRIFGAADFEAGFEFDWEAALLEYEDGVDLFFEEVNKGTGEFGPVILYEYGTDPFTLKAASDAGLDRRVMGTPGRSIRTPDTKQEVDDLPLYREWDPEARALWQVTPEVSGRSDRDLRLDTSWLDRIESYIAKEQPEPRKAQRPPERIAPAS